ncbi:adhesive plaque matrix protein-like [Manduca sexta]|uniref:adhesive plaque matrix protein-like n=1 Tax=Manduca sexta TaxID=7130 RepID=UPI00188F4021|nr:adhesive plaque matrix protein-like [Manduca sexta]
MAHSIMLRLAYLLTLLAVTSSHKAQTRWSRQISSYTSDISDWVPLSGPVERDPTPLPQIKRQAVAEPRILTDPFPEVSRPVGFGQDAFPTRFYNSPANRQLYLQSVPSVPSAPQNYLTDQGFGQSIRFGLSPSNFPLSQGFVAPPFTYDNIPQVKPRPQAIPAPQAVKYETYSKPLPAAPQPRPAGNQAAKIKPEPPKFVDGYRAENASNEYVYTQKKKPQSLQKIKFENAEKPKIETISQGQNVPRSEKEEVQLLYVPIESLNRGHFNFRSPISSPQLVNTDLYSQNVPRPNPLKQALTDYQTPVQKQLSEQEYFTEFNSQLKDFDQVPKYSTTPYPTAAPTTPKPKKLKPHQPPLAIFLSQETHKNSHMKVGDVLSSLKSSNTIAVLDSVNPLNAPNVFIGPSTLVPPENYVKFELPYLSNIENSDKKLKQLPFFVAPLSYNTPQGFAKIPFPSPHVGSVVINSQIKEPQTTQANVPNVIPNSYAAVPPPPQQQRQVYREQKPVTQKPTISFYSTSPPKTYSPTNYQSNYYSFEPQMVSSLEPQKFPETATVPQKPSNYFIGNAPQEYNQFNKFPQNEYRPQEPAQYIPKQTPPPTTTTQRTTTRTTTTKPSTYPSQLLETHNPYSINQAFHFSTPLDYHNYFDDVKEPVATPRTPEFRPSPTLNPISTSPAPPKTEEVVTQKQTYPQEAASPNYSQNYSPEIQYETDIKHSRYPVYNTNDYTTKSEASSEYNQPPTDTVIPTDNTENVETQQPILQENQTEILNSQNAPEVDPSQVYEYNQYETNYNQEEAITSTSTTTTTTTTRRPLRSRGRPRYTTPRSDSNESTSRPVVTRKPLRERRPLPTRQRYEPNKITTEKPTRKPTESYESTTKTIRTRTRGRVQYKVTDNEELYDRRVKTHNSKEEDLAYQRDVLHQNYPVTLMERTSTVDIEAITEPAPRISSTRNIEPLLRLMILKMLTLTKRHL